MSLFPAYADAGPSSPSETAVQESSWQIQPNFPAVVSNVTAESDASDESQSEEEKDVEPSPPKKKAKKVKKVKKVEQPSLTNDLYTIDVERDLGYLKMDKLAKRCQPRYEKPSKSLPGVFAAKKNPKRPIRYFSKKMAVRSGQDNLSIGEDLKKTVEILNTAVRKDPTSYEDWMKLVYFQEDYFKYQPIQFKTTGERDRAINSQKLAIIERAMAANADNESFQQLWLQLAQDCLTVDEIERKLLELLKDKGHSLIMCFGDVLLSQQSMPRCKVLPVMKKYQIAMERLQKSRHLSSSAQDNATLELFFYACVFLQQSGLWETAWTAIKLILHLNLSLDISDVSAADSTVLAEEESIITASQDVPVWHLWIRLELLRQGHHFLPINVSEYFPQRVVGSEEVVHLIHHVRRNAHFRLLQLLPILANVPLLPQSHALITCISSQLPSWAFDTVEFHLSAIFTNSPLLKINDEFLTRHIPKSQPPQYLQNYHGQTEFLKLALETFATVLQATAERQRDAIGVWFLRFLRFLNLLSSKQIYKHPVNLGKLTGLAKKFLAKSENRENVILYVEYALLLNEMGQKSQSLDVLRTVMMQNKRVFDETDINLKTYCLTVYRTMCEIQIASGQLKEAKSILKTLCQTESDAIANNKLKQMSQNGLECVIAYDDLEDLLLPDFVTESVTCYAYFLALSDHVSYAISFLDESLKNENLKPFIRERIYGNYIGIMRTCANSKPRSEIPIVLQMLREFPYNSLPLIVLGEAMTNGGGLWWKDMTYLIHVPNNMGAVITVCAVLERQRRHGEKDFRCRGLLERLTGTGNKVSTLVHRIHLTLLKELGEVEALEAARIRALEAYPWHKGLYVEAIASSPAELLPLTDLIVEKDLRIHITLDEVETLRN